MKVLNYEMKAGLFRPMFCIHKYLRYILVSTSENWPHRWGCYSSIYLIFSFFVFCGWEKTNENMLLSRHLGLLCQQEGRQTSSKLLPHGSGAICCEKRQISGIVYLMASIFLIKQKICFFHSSSYLAYPKFYHDCAKITLDFQYLH